MAATTSYNFVLLDVFETALIAEKQLIWTELQRRQDRQIHLNALPNEPDCDIKRLANRRAIRRLEQELLDLDRRHGLLAEENACLVATVPDSDSRMCN